MDAQLASLERAGDARRYFLGVYRGTTQAVASSWRQAASSTRTGWSAETSSSPTSACAQSMRGNAASRLQSRGRVASSEIPNLHTLIPHGFEVARSAVRHGSQLHHSTVVLLTIESVGMGHVVITIPARDH